jgi:5-methylcytosine-specific restriction endonuclease McrA
MMQTLLLTPWMTPHKIVSWQTAVTLLYLGKIDVIEEYDEEIHSPSLTIRTPSVVRLKKPIEGIKRGVKFSRVNVFTRDGFRCQYCGAKKAMRDLNYDHVIPRVRGGKTCWENIVTSCYACNDKKGMKTLEEAKMKLLRQPFKPKTLPMSFVVVDSRRLPPTWAEYCSTGSLIDAQDALDVAS